MNTCVFIVPAPRRHTLESTSMLQIFVSFLYVLAIHSLISTRFFFSCTHGTRNRRYRRCRRTRSTRTPRSRTQRLSNYYQIIREVSINLGVPNPASSGWYTRLIGSRWHVFSIYVDWRVLLRLSGRTDEEDLTDVQSSFVQIRIRVRVIMHLHTRRNLYIRG